MVSVNKYKSSHILGSGEVQFTRIVTQSFILLELFPFVHFFSLEFCPVHNSKVFKLLT